MLCMCVGRYLTPTQGGNPVVKGPPPKKDGTEVDMDVVRSYTRDLKASIEESGIAERKSSLRSFIGMR